MISRDTKREKKKKEKYSMSEGEFLRATLELHTHIRAHPYNCLYRNQDSGSWWYKLAR